MIFVSQAAAAAIELHPRGNVGKHLKHFFDTSGVPIQISDGYVNLSRLHQAAIYCFFHNFVVCSPGFHLKLRGIFRFAITLALSTSLLLFYLSAARIATHTRT